MARLAVVDDEPDILMLVATKLRRLGHEVVTASDGAAGLELVRSALPDLVILDWMMPALTGLEVCERIKGDPVLAAIPVLLLTARTQQSDLDAVFAAGANGYLPKPFSTSELTAAIEKLLGPQ
jgi:CheY-like chemotaxis protein